MSFSLTPGANHANPCLKPRLGSIICPDEFPVNAVLMAGHARNRRTFQDCVKLNPPAARSGG
jgi:hypothetical protein